ncbi:hypothetical protein DQ04_13421010 [Trypanosoma grayi]|uniref:hypothetical protein n=1 Tax=Trypanosoma grayi TaxID=71804 RepID=UPI0004F49EBF|nr:hypothetical protein DQ04_13421010 [Trypanosoma grayi]KEG06541.1 hypothetical protein DQ04_13421010 [Trypanosoma grayi]
MCNGAAGSRGRYSTREQKSQAQVEMACAKQSKDSEKENNSSPTTKDWNGGVGGKRHQKRHKEEKQQRGRRCWNEAGARRLRLPCDASACQFISRRFAWSRSSLLVHALIYPTLSLLLLLLLFVTLLITVCLCFILQQRVNYRDCATRCSHMGVSHALLCASTNPSHFDSFPSASRPHRHTHIAVLSIFVYI